MELSPQAKTLLQTSYTLIKRLTEVNGVDPMLVQLGLHTLADIREYDQACHPGILTLEQLSGALAAPTATPPTVARLDIAARARKNG